MPSAAPGGVDERRRAARRGPVPAAPADLRTRHVSVRLNDAELAHLDERRASVQMQRGEFLRCAALHQLPPTIPVLNRHAWERLARASSNLNQLAHAANLVGQPPDVAAITDALGAFRLALIGAERE
jgi:hypothetical protein